MDNNYSISNEFKLYVWDDWCSDYDTGVAIAIASSLEEAKALVMEDYGITNKVIKWGDYYTKPLNKPFAVHY